MENKHVIMLIIVVLALGLLIGGITGEATKRRKQPPKGGGGGKSSGGCSGIDISPGTNIQAVIDSYPKGTTFCIKKGTHRITNGIIPKSFDKLIGEPGAIISGSKLINSFRIEGNYWVIDNVTPHFLPHGICYPSSYEGCKFADSVFFDDMPLWQVMSIEELIPSTFYFDYNNNRIYLAEDPTNHKIEVTVSWRGIQGAIYRASSAFANNVEVKNLIVEKIGNMAQHGAIESYSGINWIIKNNEVRYNHGVGICGDTGSIVRNNYVHHQGQLGLCGHGNNSLYEDNEVAFNNIAGFSPGWEAGGSKWAFTNQLTVRNNNVHDNHGPGLWTDINNINTLYERNTVENNERAGIFHEISYDAIIRDNTVIGNGFNFSVWLWGGGILIAGSPNVEIYNNIVEKNADGIALIQQNRGEGLYGKHELENVYVHDNTITILEGATGLVQDIGNTSYFTSKNNRFENNTYYLGKNVKYFVWMNSWQSIEGWQSFGNDINGLFFTI